MKTCMLSFHCCPYSLLGGNGSGGMSVYLRELSSALTSYPEVKIDIFTRIQDSSIRGIKNISPHIRIVHLKGGPERELDRKGLYSYLPQFLRNMDRFICQENKGYDIIHSHYWLSGLVGEWMKHRFGYPHVHTYHTLGFLKQKVFSQEEHPARMKSEQHLAQAVDKIISPSAEEKDELLKEYGIPSSKVKVVFPGVNGALFSPIQNHEIFRESRNEHTILYIGRIDPIKGLMTIIEALNELREKNKDLFNSVKLVVIGGGEKEKEMPLNSEAVRVLRAVEQRKLADKIQFLGSKKHHELRPYYSSADVLIVPSLYESFGLVTIEALACGTPVIVSRVGKMKTIIEEGKNGFSFRPNDPNSLSACLEHFFKHNDQLWNRQRIRRDVLERFSWEQTARKIYVVYAGLVGRSKYPTTISQPDEILPPA